MSSNQVFVDICYNIQATKKGQNNIKAKSRILFDKNRQNVQLITN